MERLGKKFGQWLVKKVRLARQGERSLGGHRTRQGRFRQRQGRPLQDLAPDAAVEGRPGPGASTTNCSSIAETQRQFYADMATYYREAARLQAAAQRQQLGHRRPRPAERRRSAGPTPPWTSWPSTSTPAASISATTTAGASTRAITSPTSSCLTDPRGLPTNLKQVVGHPIIVTESTWVSPGGLPDRRPVPDRGLPVADRRGGLLLVRGDGAEYDLDPCLRFLNLDGQHPLFKWSCSTPALMAQFPAAALMYRQGYIQPGRAGRPRGTAAGGPVGSARCR